MQYQLVENILFSFSIITIFSNFQYTTLFGAFATTSKSEIVLLNKVQDYCYENMNFLKTFNKIVLLLYKSKDCFKVGIFWDHKKLKKIFHFVLMLLSTYVVSKTGGRFFLAFSQYLNFTNNNFKKMYLRMLTY